MVYRNGHRQPWWIESNNESRDTWAFAVSITCLGIPKEFGWYAYSSIDLGQKDIVTDFTQVQTTTYPFHDLAAQAYTSTSSTEKLEGIKSLKAVIASGKKQAKGLKPILTKTKSITSANKKTYFSTIRDFKSYAKNADTQISQLEALPYDDNFKSKATFFILRL